MCLTSKHKLKEKLDFFKEVRHVSYPKKTNSKHRILFHKGEACASPLSTSLRRNLDFSRRVRHVSHKKKIQNIEFCFIRVRHVPHL